MRTPLVIGLALVLAGSAAAQPTGDLLVVPSKNSIRTYVFTEKKAGKTGIRGKIKKVQGDRVWLTVYKGSATWDETAKLDEFTPVSRFRIMQAVTPDTAEAQLGLARYGLAQDAPVQARYALRVARKLAGDPKLGADLEAELRKETATLLQARFHDSLAKGKIATARQTLRELNRHYSDVVSPDARSQLQAALETREADFKAQAAERRAKEATARQDKEFHRKLNPLRKRLERGQANVKRGLNAGSSMSKALGAFKRANSDLDRVVRGCEQLRKKYGNEPRYTSDINYVHEQGTRALTDSLLHSASILTSRGSFNKALGNVNKVLAMDSNNTRALAMRGRIEAAANEGWY
ncbi:MAG: hypothetical protein ACYTGW_08840 [Planctomycetota bacterium]